MAFVVGSEIASLPPTGYLTEIGLMGGGATSEEIDSQTRANVGGLNCLSNCNSNGTHPTKKIVTVPTPRFTVVMPLSKVHNIIQQ